MFFQRISNCTVWRLCHSSLTPSLCCSSLKFVTDRNSDVHVALSPRWQICCSWPNKTVHKAKLWRFLSKLGIITETSPLLVSLYGYIPTIISLQRSQLPLPSLHKSCHHFTSVITFTFPPQSKPSFHFNHDNYLPSTKPTISFFFLNYALSNQWHTHDTDASDSHPWLKWMNEWKFIYSA